MNATRSSFYLIGLLSLAVPAVLAVGCDDVTEEGAGGAGGGGGSGSGTSVLELGTVDATTEDEVNGVFYGELTVNIPSGVKGVNFIAELPSSAASEDLVMVDVLRRGDTVIRDYWATDGQEPQRGEPIEGVFTMQYPTAETVDFATGEHTLRVASTSSLAGVKVYGIYKTDGSTSSGTLDVNIYFAGIDDLSAATQADHPQFQEMWTEAQRIYGKAHITVGNVQFFDLTDDSLFELSGPGSAPGDDLARLFAKSGGNPGRAVNLFFIRRLSQGTGDPLLGISGGVPGPGEMVGTVHSGIVANGEDLLATGGPKLIAQIAVHETFHYLGLNHTSERGWGDGTCPGGDNTFDPIPDTPECGSAQDGTTGNPPNCSVGPGECLENGADNLMFWQGVNYDSVPAERDIVVSEGQSYVLLRNPLTK